MDESDWVGKDYYATLGVAADAKHDEIEKAYRKLARKYHPDLNRDEGATEKFKEVNEAHDVLGDEDKRRKYDAIRTYAKGGAGAGRGASPFGAGWNVYTWPQPGDHLSDWRDYGPTGGIRFTTGGGGFDTSIFDTPEGERRYWDSLSGEDPEDGDDRHVTVGLTVRQAIRGATIAVTTQDGRFNVRIPAGITDGRRVRVRGRGKDGTNGGAAGDLYITVHIKPSDGYETDGADIIRTLPITVGEAVNGTTIHTTGPDGEPADYVIPAGTSSGYEAILPGRGLTKAGRLIGRAMITVPANPTKEQKTAATRFDESCAK